MSYTVEVVPTGIQVVFQLDPSISQILDMLRKFYKNHHKSKKNRT